MKKKLAALLIIGPTVALPAGLAVADCTGVTSQGCGYSVQFDESMFTTWVGHWCPGESEPTITSNFGDSSDIMCAAMGA